MHITATLQGDWTEPTARKATAEWLASGVREMPDLVFGLNDRSALGARAAFLSRQGKGQKMPLFIGVDGLPGKDGGIAAVLAGTLDATYIYPTNGSRVLELALDILTGKPYAKETKLQAAIVTPANAEVLLMQAEEMQRQQDYLEELHTEAAGYLRQLTGQKAMTWAAVFGILLLLAALVMVYVWQVARMKLHESRERLARQQIDFYTQAAHRLRTPLTLITGPLALVKADGATAEEMLGIVRRGTGELSALVDEILSGAGDKEIINSEELEIRNETNSDLDSKSSTGNTSSDSTILIVDDNADIRAYVRQVLHGRTILEACDGREGLEIARREVPDLIVSDVMMPVMNGLEFCQSVKEDYVTSHIPVVLLTARALSRQQAEGYRVGADAYITKPFAAEVLAACVEAQLRGRRKLKELFSIRNEKSEMRNEMDTDLNSDTNHPALLSPPSSQNTSRTSAIETAFVSRLREVIETHLAESEFTVESLASEMNLSRVQLYRKVKAITGSTPVELLRRARLTKARELLATSDMTVSEVAYACGFTAPSYFTKCYKEEFGALPSGK